jgi:hypothetical protein
MSPFVRQKLIVVQSLGSKDRPKDQIGVGSSKKGLITLTILQEKQGTLARRSCGWASLAGKVDPGTAQTVHRSRGAVIRNLLEAAPRKL